MGIITWDSERKPSALGHSNRTRESDGIITSFDLQTFGTGDTQAPYGDVIVGYENQQPEHGVQLNKTYRGLVKFNVDNLAEPFVHASLIFNLKGGVWDMEGADATNAVYSMLMYIALADSDWLDPANQTKDSDQTTGFLYLELPEMINYETWMWSDPSGLAKVLVHHGSGTFVIDVTQPVLEWYNGTRPNNGFVLSSAVEDLDGDNSDTRYSIYGNFVLVVHTDLPFMVLPAFDEPYLKILLIPGLISAGKKGK